MITARPLAATHTLRELGSYLGEAGAREVSGANPRLLLDCLANYYGRADLDLPPDFSAACAMPAARSCCSTAWTRWSRATIA